MLSLNIIRDISETDPYGKLINFIHDPRYIRFGPNESIKTMVLADCFNKTMNENLAYKNTFPKLMMRFISEYPLLAIIKEVKNYGTIYRGIGLASDPIPEKKKAHIVRKEYNITYRGRSAKFLDEAETKICAQCNWTANQYRQMGNLGLIELAKDGKSLNLEATIYLIMGRLVSYVRNKNLKLMMSVKSAMSVKIAFSKAILWDKVLSEGNGTPVYTNRLLIAEETYTAGEKLERDTNLYKSRIQSLPILSFIIYPNLEEVSDLITWLKSNSLYKTRLDMKIKQEEAESDTPQCVDWTIEDIVDEYDINKSIVING